MEQEMCSLLREILETQKDILRELKSVNDNLKSPSANNEVRMKEAGDMINGMVNNVMANVLKSMKGGA